MPFSSTYPFGNPDEDPNCDPNDPNFDPSDPNCDPDRRNGPFNAYDDADPDTGLDEMDELGPEERRQMIEGLKENPPDFDDMSDGCLRAIHGAWMGELSGRMRDHLESNPSPTHRPMAFSEGDRSLDRFRSMSQQELTEFIGRNPQALQGFTPAQITELQAIVRDAGKRPAKFAERPPVPGARRRELLAQTQLGRQVLGNRTKR
jgi:hypothetical protein